LQRFGIGGGRLDQSATGKRDTNLGGGLLALNKR
jgi:hypothetical protein